MARRHALSIAGAVVFILAVGSVVRGQDLPVDRHPDTSGWQDLFGPDLSKADFAPGEWVMENGILHAKGHGTIWTKASYGDFVLDLEFKVAKGANSGVFLRAGSVNNILSALEIQIHETTDGTRYGMVGALYDAKAPSRNVAKPAGEWNHYTITCKGSRLYLVFNGTQVLNLDLNDWTEAHKNPDGTPNKFAVALKDYARRGPIGLQGIHGAEERPVWFRNLKIKILE